MPVSNPDALPANVSGVDGIWYKDRFSTLPSPGIQPGVKFYTLGQQSGNAVPSQAAPTAAPTLAAAAGSTALLAGNYFVAYSWRLTTGVETYVGPISSTITLTAGQQINVSGIQAFPGGVNGARFYFGVSPNGVNAGFISERATNASFSITTAGDATFGPQKDQGFGTYQVPALTFGVGNGASVSVADALITANSRVLVSIRKGSTVAAAGAFPIVANITAQVAGNMIVKVVNIGTANSLVTDWVFDYEVQN